MKVIEEAARKKADALIVHHGIFWNKDSYPIMGIKKSKIEHLLTHGISLFGYHLPMDAHKELGNNWKAAKDLGWEELLPFGYVEKQSIGVRGTFQEMELQEFKRKLEHYYGREATVVEGGKKKVSSAALISGGAYKFLSEAATSGVHCFITGNFDEPVWHNAVEEKINFFALGHHATERVGPNALVKYLNQALKLEAFFIDEANPF
jgi:dinuclear metal center YbgI/SA1388 family protein